MTRLFTSVTEDRGGPINLWAVLGCFLLYIPAPQLALLSRLLLPSSQRDSVPFVLGQTYLLLQVLCACGLVFAAHGLNLIFPRDKESPQTRSLSLERVLLGIYHFAAFCLGPALHAVLYSGQADPFARGLSVVLVTLPATVQCLVLHRLGAAVSSVTVGGITVATIWVGISAAPRETAIFALSAAFCTAAATYVFASGFTQDPLQNLLDAMPLAAYILDSEGEAIPANRQAVSLLMQFGYESGKKLLCAADINGKETVLSRCSSAGRSGEGVAQIRPARGQLGRPYDFAIFRCDSSAGRRIAVTLKEPNKDRDWEESRRTGLLCSLSHELCTPLNGLLPLLRLLPKGEQEEGRTHEIILSNAEILYSKIQDLLDFTKLETHEIKHELICFEVGKVFDELQSIFKYEADSKKNCLSFMTKAKDSLRIMADRKRIKQVLVKLVANAIKYTNRGLIEVSALAVHNSADVTFSVLDSGIGMTEEKRRNIFAPLTRKQVLFSPDWSTVARLGIGLTISQKICESLGSRLEALPGQGRGTTFAFTVKNCRMMVAGSASPAAKRRSNCLVTHKEFSISPRNVKTRRSSKDFDVTYLLSDRLLAKRPQRAAAQSPAAAAVTATLPIAFEICGDHKDDSCEEVAEELATRPTLPMQEPKAPSRVLISNCDVVCQAGMLRRSQRRGRMVSSTSLLVGLREPRTFTDPGEILNRQSCPLMMEYKRRHESSKDSYLKSLAGVEEEKSPVEPLCVLVADDGASNRYVLRAMLDKLGISSVEAVDGEDAYEKVKESFEGRTSEKLGLILMDLDMPRLDGIAATRKIRNLEYHLKRDIEIPIVAVTAFDTESVKTLCFNVRMQQFLTKPLDFTTLKATVQKYV